MGSLGWNYVQEVEVCSYRLASCSVLESDLAVCSVNTLDEVVKVDVNAL